MPRSRQANNLYHCPRKQHGAALMVMLVIMVMGAATFLVNSLSSSALQIERNKKTADAMAQAKEALVGYAVKVQVSNSNLCAPNCPRPGDLPCPDKHTPGSALEGTSSSPCDQQAQRLGRLPWKTLGLPGLRDGSGERLWYAVSTNFKNSTRSGTLNSDTAGTITVRSSDGNMINDASLGNGVVAVIIAPGDVLQRQGGSQQDRSSAGNNIASNYLDIANSIDNASFTDNTTNGFIQGRIKDSSGNIILNDQLLVITQNNIMQPVQKRVAAEVKNCLNDYANNNNGRYPWATPLSDLGTYHDNSDEYFGRVSDDLDNTRNDSFTGFPSFTYTMDNQWGATCNTHFNQTPSGWWINWKEMVFYGVARRFRPNDTNAPSFPSTCASAGNCLSINSPSMPARFVVIVAGKKLSTPDQANRSSNKSNAFYFLESGNQNADQSGGYTFIQGLPSATFNDTVVYQ